MPAATPEVSEAATTSPHPLVKASCATHPINTSAGKARRGTMGGTGPAFALLPDSALVRVFKWLPPSERRATIPLVCKRFAVVANATDNHHELWEQVQLSFPADFQQTVSLARLYAWFVRRQGSVRSLHIDVSTAAAWAPIQAVLGVAGRALEHLRVAGDAQESHTPGCTAPWLSLVPNLVSLELDDVVDHSVSDAHFPPGGCQPAAAACLAACNCARLANECVAAVPRAARPLLPQRSITARVCVTSIAPW